MQSFLSFALDIFLSRECLVCEAELHPFELISLKAPPTGWSCDMIDFLSTDIRLAVFGELSVRADVLCPRCWLTLDPSPWPGMLAPSGGLEAPIQVVSPFFENDSLLALVRFLKFSGGKAAVPSLAWWMARALKPFLEREQGRPYPEPLLVPVPLHPSRERSRGYNQAALLAYDVADRLGLEVDGTLLARVKNTKSQSKLEKSERSENVRGAFHVPRADRVNSNNIILIDDLVTTGETIRACARALAGAGPASIMVLSAGRVRDSFGIPSESYP